MSTPTLREYKKPERLSEYPDATCFEAGYLVAKNAGWRSVCPVVDNGKCVGCGKCYKYCPDGVIKMADGKPVVDMDFCKGCGICAKICPLHALVMQKGK